MTLDLKYFTIAFIHPRYLLRQGSPREQQFFSNMRKNQRYGSYEDYLQHLSSLHASLTKPALFFCDVQKGKLHPYHAPIMPRPQDIVIEWSSMGDTWDMRYQGKQIEKKFFRAFLRKRGIKKVALAGECGPCEESLRGCVGTIHKLLSPSIEVRGVQGCIYPQVAYRQHLKDARTSRKELWNLSLVEPIRIREYQTMLSDLYDRALTPSSALPQS
jgi:hypothetical protein